jgi:hypothetical protein
LGVTRLASALLAGFDPSAGWGQNQSLKISMPSSFNLSISMKIDSMSTLYIREHRVALTMYHEPISE